MKKSLIVLTLILVVVASLSLTACANTPLQSILIAPWDEYTEIATYDVSLETAKDTFEKGKMNVSYKRYKGDPLVLSDEFVKADYSSDSFFGFVITTDLVMDNGEYKHSIIITDSQIRPIYSIASSHLRDRNTADKYEDLNAEFRYNEKNCTYKVSGSIDKTGTIKYKPFQQAAYFDNAMYIAITRTLGPINSQRQLAFGTPSFREDKMLKRVAGTTPRQVEIKPSDNIKAESFEHPEKKEDKSTVTCFESNIASTESMPGSGTPIRYFVSSVPYTTADGVKVDKLLLKFIEHNVTYTLTDVQMVANH